LTEGGKMADVMRGDFKDLKCSDCGRTGCVFRDWSPTVPGDKIGNFCWSCWLARNVDFNATKVVKPWGTIWRKVPDEFLDKGIKVITKSGSIYNFSRPDAKGLRMVSRTNKTPLHFQRATIILLSAGTNMCLLIPGEDDYITTNVVSMK
jgi:hypothetical protein